MKNILITGGTFGIGRATVASLLASGHGVTMLARNSDQAQQMKNLPGGENLSFIATDLTNPKSVISSKEELKNKFDVIDVLINNAGGIITKKQLTSAGLEMTFALNHIGHFLLTDLLMPVLIKSKARIINVSSAAHQMGKLDFEDLNWQKHKYSAFKAYANAKLCNIYFTRELHRRYHDQGISSFSLHPGVVRTQFGLNSTGLFNLMVKMAQPFMISAEKGAETSIYLALEPGIEKYSGKYFTKKKPISSSEISMNEKSARQLWETSERIIADFKNGQ